MQYLHIYDLIKIGDNMDHIEEIFNNMIEDIKYIKLATYFKNMGR